MDLKLKDKVVLITGSTGGIGAAITRAFATEGAKLAISSTRQEKLDALIPTLGVDEDHVWGFVMDATQEDQVKAFVEGAAEHYGTIDVAIPNAGYEGKVAPIQDVDFEEVQKVYSLNVFSPMFVMKYAVPYMLRQKSGSIVVIASAGSYTPAATMSTYCSSKYAVAGLTKCVANEVGAEGVHVNYICPVRWPRT